MLLCNIFLNTKLTKFRIFKIYDSINAKQAAFSSCTCNCCQATNVYRKCIFIFFIPYANKKQLKAEGDLAALKHWYPYSHIMHDKTLFSTLCFPFYVFALSAFIVLNEHNKEHSTSTFAKSISF
jgi:hypothetical protein